MAGTSTFATSDLSAPQPQSRKPPSKANAFTLTSMRWLLRTRSICAKNHPFVDGNKRVALLSGLVFLDLNGIAIADPDDRLYPLMMSVASGRAQKPEIAAVFRQLVTGEDDNRQ